MSKHTPSPWVIVRAGEANPQPTGVRSDAVATGMICHVPHLHEDSAANLRLIVNAPELLNLLEKLFLTVSAVEMCNKNMHGNNRCGVAPELLAEVKGLIEKAKGGA